MTSITARKQLLSLLISQILAVPTHAAVFNINCGVIHLSYFILGNCLIDPKG